MANIWVIAANSEYARLFKTTGVGQPLEEFETLVCSAARQSEQDLVSDRPGRSFDSSGSGRHAMEPGEQAGEHIARAFAKEVAHFLDESFEQGHFNHLVVMASPGFLGLLRTEFSQQVRSVIRQEVNKNLVRLQVSELCKHLPDHLT